MVGVYKITNKQNGKSYIGQSVHCGKRLDEHCGGSQLIDEIIQIDGIENFTFEILKNVEKSELSLWEDYYILKYNTMFPNGYNQKWNCNQEAREAFLLKEGNSKIIQDKNENENNFKTETQKQAEKQKALLTIEDIIADYSMKLLAYLFSLSKIYTSIEDNSKIRIIPFSRIILANIGDLFGSCEKTLKKNLGKLEDVGVIRFYKEKNQLEDYDETDQPIPFNEKWKVRKQYRDSYYLITPLGERLFRKIPLDTLIKINEVYKLREVAFKTYLFLIILQDTNILNSGRQTFTFKDLRELLKYRPDTRTNQSIERGLEELQAAGLIKYRKGFTPNRYKTEISLFTLDEINYKI